MPRSEFSEMIQRAHGMVEHVRENLTVQELDLFLDEIAPLPEPVESEPKKASKKRGRKASKSRAPIAEKTGEASSNGLCAFDYGDGITCLAIPSNAIHDPKAGYGGYHEFVAAKAASGGA
jgi:hypothetical protein